MHGRGRSTEAVLVPIVTTLAHTEALFRRRADHHLHEIGSLFARERSLPYDECHVTNEIAWPTAARRAHARLRPRSRRPVISERATWRKYPKNASRAAGGDGIDIADAYREHRLRFLVPPIQFAHRDVKALVG